MAKKNTITPSQIKNTNRKLIYDLIYREKNLSQQDIVYSLRLSRPTVTTNLAELEDEGLIFKSGLISSDQIGRKAAAYSIVPDHRLGIGVEIAKNSVTILAVDLYGNQNDKAAFSLEFENNSGYYKRVCDEINAFIKALKVEDERILGVCIAVQGLVSPDQVRVVFGAIMDNTGLSIDAFTRHIKYPCSFIHDSESAAIAEHWFNPDYHDAVFLLLSYHLGGATIRNGEICFGKHGHNSTMEHIKMRHANAKKCYCGKKGCAETLLSMEALLEGEEIGEFIDKVRNEEPESLARWNEWLKNLGMLISVAHLINDTDYILGGFMAEYIIDRDIEYIYDVVRENNAFKEDDDFIKTALMPKHGIALGGALTYIKKFLEKL